MIVGEVVLRDKIKMDVSGGPDGLAIGNVGLLPETQAFSHTSQNIVSGIQYKSQSLDKLSANLA